jgi:hypothetical protein
VRVLREYQRGVVFRLGRLLGEPKGPGLFLLIPIIDRMVQVDLRTITLVVPPQEVGARAVYFVHGPAPAITQPSLPSQEHRIVPSRWLRGAVQLREGSAQAYEPACVGSAMDRISERSFSSLHVLAPPPAPERLSAHVLPESSVLWLT